MMSMFTLLQILQNILLSVVWGMLQTWPSRYWVIFLSCINSLIRRDSNRVDIDSLIKIARALGVTAEYFCNEESAPHTRAAHFDGTEYTEEQLDRIEAFAKFIKHEGK